MFNLQMQDPADLPLALKDLVGKTYLFKVGIKKENYLYKSGTYKVIKICTNIDMVAEFENLSQPKVVKKNIWFSFYIHYGHFDDFNNICFRFEGRSDYFGFGKLSNFRCTGGILLFYCLTVCSRNNDKN